MDLQSAVVVITGASKGVGHALKVALEAHGATVYGCAREASDGIRAVNVQDEQAVHSFVQRVLDEQGHIDCLINNAGSAHPVVDLDLIPTDDYRRCMRTNVDGVFHGMKAVLPDMKRRGSGVIINIASRAGRKAHPGLSVYSASKFAVIGMTQAVAKELKDSFPDVLCFSLSPGGVDTDMRTQLFGQDDAKRQQSPDLVARCVLSILSGDLEVSNGMDIQIVGGETQCIPLA